LEDQLWTATLILFYTDQQEIGPIYIPDSSNSITFSARSLLPYFLSALHSDLFTLNCLQRFRLERIRNENKKSITNTELRTEIKENINIRIEKSAVMTERKRKVKSKNKHGKKEDRKQERRHPQ
jgi:hypothetical protein